MASDRQISGWRARSDGQLVIGPRLVSEIAAEYGTPLYVYDTEMISDRFGELSTCFPNFEISYAVKTNPNLEVCSLLCELGAAAGVSSLREISIAIDAGFVPAGIDYVGPGKTDADLTYAADSGVGLVSVESEAELHKIASLESLKDTKLILRVNTRHRATSAGEVMAGGPSPFGIDEEDIARTAEVARSLGLEVIGFHTFIASQVLAQDFLSYHFAEVARRAKELARLAKIDLEVLNFGGGFGVPYGVGERALRMEMLGNEVIDGPAGALAESGVRCIIDVGRYLAAESGLFITRIVDVKKSRGINYVVTESGISGISRPAMPWGQRHQITRLSDPFARGGDTYKVVGPSCMPGDVLADGVQLSDPQPGDNLVVYDAGAYGMTMSLLAWGGFKPPREVVVRPGGKDSVFEASEYY